MLDENAALLGTTGTREREPYRQPDAFANFRCRRRSTVD